MNSCERTFRIRMSERCFPLEPGFLPENAPRRPGVYEFLAYDARNNPEVLYIGLAEPRTLYDRLADHIMGNIRPTADELRKGRGRVYFDFVAPEGACSSQDLHDIAGALMIRHNPRYNLRDNPPGSGRYGRVLLQEF
ncbi:MAG: hypothetical protein WCU88_09485 [Elusimicrobiota bacterium]|jgi:hypothetical protein